MKIEIELLSSYEAAITVDGRKMKYGHQDGFWRFTEGLTTEEQDSTLGGIVIAKLMSDMPDILQGWMPEACRPDGDRWDTWEKLSEEAADEVYMAIC